MKLSEQDVIVKDENENPIMLISPKSDKQNLQKVTLLQNNLNLEIRNATQEKNVHTSPDLETIKEKQSALSNKNKRNYVK